MLPHYPAQITSLNFGKSETARRREVVRLLVHSTGSVATEQSWPQPCQLGLHDTGHRPAASLSVAGAHHWWTEAAFAACLAWHWPDHHWQCNWRVVWCLRACVWAKDGHVEQLLWQYSAIWQEVSVFVKCDTIFRLLCKLPQIWTSNFRKVVQQHTEDMVGSIIWVLLAI